MSVPAIDDLVTVLDGTGKLLVHARWGSNRDRDNHEPFISYLVYRRGMAGSVLVGAFRLADENVTWCRGHVSEKDDAGKALLVGAALKDDSGARMRFYDATPTVALRGRTGRMINGVLVMDETLPALPSPEDWLELMPLTTQHASPNLAHMANEITVREIENTDFVQHAELRIPIDNPDEVKKAFEVVHALRKRALDHLEVTEENADATALTYVKVDGDVAVIEVEQVNV